MDDQNSQHFRLRISEIFCSLQGESRSVGFPTTFVRLTGCPLRCTYCDTVYAFKGGEWLSISSILEHVARYGVRHVTLTGGEPLAQEACIRLIRKLCDLGHEVSIETSGALDISAVDQRATLVMDLKTPASGEAHRNRFQNLEWMKPQDQIKFVISDRADYLWSKDQVHEWKLLERCEVLFSPNTGMLAPQELAEWILQDRLEVRFQLQLHKLLWGNVPGH